MSSNKKPGFTKDEIKRIIAARNKKPGLTKAERAAIEYIGSHRKTQTKVGTGHPVSTRTFNSLKKKLLVMWLSEERQICMLTANGEREWTRLHPSSKYRIK